MIAAVLSGACQAEVASYGILFQQQQATEEEHETVENVKDTT
jgi:hypothetical protein